MTAMFTHENTKLGLAVSTPFGEHPICGFGFSTKSEPISHVSFGNSAAPVGYWTFEHGFETAAQQKVRMFDESFAALSKDEQKLVDWLIADRDPETRHLLKTADKLVFVAMRKLIKDGKMQAETCTRCGGCGRYSYNQMDGDRCFKCRGSGKQFPKMRVALACIAA